MKGLFFFFLLFLSVCSNAQVTADTTKKDTSKTACDMVKTGFEVKNGDTIPVYLLKKFKVNKESEATQAEKDAFARLVRYVKKALPYAKLAAFRIQVMEDNLSLIISAKEKKKYVKACEKSIKAQFMDDLKNLYVEEGRILLKLIHRETGKTTFDIMKNYSGSMETIFWQTMAKTYKANMKDTYDPVVDYRIEEIIKSLNLDNALPQN